MVGPGAFHRAHQAVFYWANNRHEIWCTGAIERDSLDVLGVEEEVKLSRSQQDNLLFTLHVPGVEKRKINGNLRAD